MTEAPPPYPHEKRKNKKINMKENRKIATTRIVTGIVKNVNICFDSVDGEV